MITCPSRQRGKIRCCPSCTPKTWLGEGHSYGMLYQRNQTVDGWQKQSSGWPGWRLTRISNFSGQLRKWGSGIHFCVIGD